MDGASLLIVLLGGMVIVGLVSVYYLGEVKREAADLTPPPPIEPLPDGLPEPSADAPPAPPATPEHEAALVASRDQAVLLRRDFPPRPGALSHWGGVPSVPRDFTWPFFVTTDGTERAMHHVLQLDCSTIPEAGRLGLMPDRGLIYVFLDLDWGIHWRWSVRYVDATPDQLVPAPVPASLPHAYGERASWRWPSTDAEWPRLLPAWSIDPVVVTGDPAAEVDEPDFWPGTVRLAARVAAIDGAVVEARWFSTSHADGVLVRPWSSYPHDWRAVSILTGHLARQARRQHLDHHVRQGVMTEAEADDSLVRLRAGAESWSARAAASPAWAPLTAAESDEVWQLVLDHQPVAHVALADAVNDSLDATLAGNPDAARVLPAEALDLVRSRHALATRRADGELHVADVDRMLSAPSYVQGDAEERIGEWILLLEMSSDEAIGHHFAEGVYQFWIRPADLAARRFDLVELTASAY
ncbi:protein of unknown function [Nocardioides exalbidus]|uniref:DUF1963 domain-containing protein n=1 Tax=Nocardioides exalbidus TaxID=402596 RepID=A0A1H4P9H9_9ACTN|nr:DUF1963 domain-containing protein [Nocardioides exalbidus]SEC04070.1 protein of unknown function [Nocardioides exalbidus]